MQRLAPHIDLHNIIIYMDLESHNAQFDLYSKAAT